MLGWIAGASKPREQQDNRTSGSNDQVVSVTPAATSQSPPQPEGTATEPSMMLTSEPAPTEGSKPQAVKSSPEGKKKQLRERRGRDRRKPAVGSPESGGGTPNNPAPTERSTAQVEGTHRTSPRPRSTKSTSSPKPQASKAAADTKKVEAGALRDELAMAKKSSVEYQRQLLHYKTAVNRIAFEIKGGTALRPDLKLAAILAICDDAQSKAETEESRRRNRRKGRRNKGKLVPLPVMDSSKRLTPMALPAPHPMHRPPAFLSSYLVDQRIQYPIVEGLATKPHWVHRGLRVSQSMGAIRAVGAQDGIRPPGSHVMGGMPSVDDRHSGRPAGPALRRGATDLPSLRSAAESDHPICIQLREGLRTANDQESVLHFIELASTHKIQDLVDRGRRKLEKLAAQQA